MSTALTGQDGGQGGSTPAGSGNQGQVADWRSSLPEDLRGDKSLESIKGKDWAEAGPVLVKNYIHAQKLVGADKLVIPGKDATPEQIAEYRKKLGVPDKPDDYAITLPEGLKEEQLNKELIATWRKRLHDQGVPKSAAEAIIKDYLTDNLGFTQAQEKAKEAERQQWNLALKEKFGDKFEENVNLARHALNQFKSDELTEWLDSTGAGDHPAVVEFFAKVGKAISDDTARQGLPGYSGKPQTAAAAQAELNQFNNNAEKQKALWDPNHPQHDAVIKERQMLFETAFPKDAE